MPVGAMFEFNLFYMTKWTTCRCLSRWVVSSLLLSQFLQSIERICYPGEFVDGDAVKTDGRGEGGYQYHKTFRDAGSILSRACACMCACVFVRVCVCQGFSVRWRSESSALMWSWIEMLYLSSHYCRRWFGPSNYSWALHWDNKPTHPHIHPPPKNNTLMPEHKEHSPVIG